MKIQQSLTRYKVEFVLDTNLSKDQILQLLGWLDASMIYLETEKEYQDRIKGKKNQEPEGGD